MFATRNLQRHCFKTLSPLLQSNPFRDVVLLKDFAPKVSSVNVGQPSCGFEDSFPLFSPLDHPFSSGWSRAMSTLRGPSRGRGSSMRSKVEKRMQKETGKTLREIRRAKKLKMKLMTDEERLIYNLKRAKKKIALLLQKLKKYELPELPTPVHDPELLTPEQIQAYKKIGFKNKNYVPVGVRGVFGGVVQNMHMHWKFHETVQVCCDNFPKEKIKEMASMLARLSGGVVINVHNVKTIIMFRGRNYRQPKNLIPVNTLTKRKALFKARFEQALESQKLNIKKLEQQLRRMGVNPEDPVAMASIRRVASTFFNAIDQRDGSPYIFHGDKQPVADPSASLEHSEPQADSDQEELDRFIAEIEDAADKEWAAEEEAEKEEYGRIRYWNREEFGGRIRHQSEASDDDDVRGERHWKEARDTHKNAGRDNDSDILYGDHDLDSDDARDASDLETNVIYSDKARNDCLRSRDTQRNPNRNGWNDNTEIYRRKTKAKFQQRKAEETSESENMLSDLDNTMWESDTEEKGDLPGSRSEAGHNFRSSSDDEEDIYPGKRNEKIKVNDSGNDQGELKISPHSFMSKGEANTRRKMAQEDSSTEDAFSDSEIAGFKSDAEEVVGEYSEGEDDYRDSAEYNDDYDLKQIQKNEVNHGKNNIKLPKDKDESWDSD